MSTIAHPEPGEEKSDKILNFMKVFRTIQDTVELGKEASQRLLLIVDGNEGCIARCGFPSKKFTC